MHDTFELLRHAAEDSREAMRQRQGGIDPANWEALLDRVEQQLDDEEQDEDGSSSEQTSQTHTDQLHANAMLPASFIASALLGAVAISPVVGSHGVGGNTSAQYIAATAAAAGLALVARPERHERQTANREGSDIAA